MGQYLIEHPNGANVAQSEGQASWYVKGLLEGDDPPGALLIIDREADPDQVVHFLHETYLREARAAGMLPVTALSTEPPW